MQRFIIQCDPTQPNHTAQPNLPLGHHPTQPAPLWGGGGWGWDVAPNHTKPGWDGLGRWLVMNSRMEVA